MPTTNGHGPESEKVALYLRVSSEEQREAGTIQTQREFLESYARLHGLEVASIYADDGISGTVHLDERPEGHRLLEDARERKFDAALVYKLDRLGRSLLVTVEAHEQLQESGVALISATEHIDTSTPSGRLHFQMLGSFAEFERENIRQRTRDGLHRAYRNGKHTGTLPYGYKVGKDGKLVVVSEEAQVVRSIFENIAAGGTIYGEVRRLNDLGVEPPGWRYRSGRTKKREPSTRWAEPTIHDMLHRRAYSGTHEVRIDGGNEVIERPVPAIVSPKLQERALSALLENRRYGGGAPTRDYFLSGLIKCEVCGASYTGYVQTAKAGKYRYAYYRCSDDHPSRRLRAEKGHAPGVRADWLEELVWSDVRAFLSDPGAVVERIQAQEGSDEAGKALIERREKLLKQLAAKHRERERRLDQHAKGHITDEELDAHIGALRAEIERLQARVEDIEGHLSAQEHEREAGRTTESYLLSLMGRIEGVEHDPTTQRELVRLLVSAITIGRDEHGRARVDITYRFGPPEVDLAEPELPEEEPALVAANRDTP
jgi:site-specific DNA recombinase